MKRTLLAACALVFCMSLALALNACADNDPGTLKEELQADRQAIKTQKEEIKSHAQAAKAEEKAIKEQIKTAVTSGDKTTAKALRGELKETHKANVQERNYDRKELRKDKKELRQDKHAARAAKRK